MSDQAEDFDLIHALVPIVRAADEQHQVEGGGTRHWLRDYFLPRLNAAGYVIKHEALTDECLCHALGTPDAIRDSRCPIHARR